MKRGHFSLLFFTSVLATSLQAQGTFINLDFDSIIPPLSRGADFQIPITDALPGWSANIGTYKLSTITYNTVSLGATDISLQGPGSVYLPANGSYTAFFQPFPFGEPAPGYPAIAQTGQIPGNARSLSFCAYSLTMQVSFAGNNIPIVDTGWSGVGGYHKYVADISPYAGQTGELRFTAIQGMGPFDDIQFSSLALVPEPGTGALVLLGLAACFGFHRVRTKA